MPDDAQQDLGGKWLRRYRVVSAVKALTATGMKPSAAVSAVVDAWDLELAGERERVSARTVRRWVAAFDAEGVEGLRDAPRSHCTSSTVLSAELLGYLREKKEKDPRASLPELLRRARIEGVLHPQAAADRTTAWRALRRLGISTRRVRRVAVEDKRRFAFSQRMRLVLGDFVHFRVGVTRAKRVAVYLLDDATRFGLGVLAGTDGEKTTYFLTALAAALRRYGRMLAVYLDHGPAFIADDATRVLAGLKVAFIHGQARYPEGHGMIEKFNQALRNRLLDSLDGAVEADPDCAALTLRLRFDLLEVYNHLPHESLGKETPHQRWTTDATPLVPLESEAVLREAFVLPELRTVSRDHCVSFAGTVYEVPVGLAGQRLTLRRALLEDDALYLDHQGRRIRLHPVDLVANATSGRARKPQPQARADPPDKTASTLSFEREYGSILAPDGGFPEREDAELFNRHKEEDDEQ